MKANSQRVLIGIGGGGFMVQAYNLIAECPANIELILFAPEAVRDKLEIALNGRSHIFVDPPRILKQKRRNNVFSLIICLLVGTWYSVRLIKFYQPDFVISVGQRVSIYLMAAAKLTGIRGHFVECVTRVTKKSGTGKFISSFGLADRIYVQWPEAETMYPRAVYRGRLV